MASYGDLVQQITKEGIDKTIVERLIEEYKEINKQNLVGDVEKAVLHSGKFSELALALVKSCFTNTPIDLNKIYFGSLLKEISTYSRANPQEDILALAIPKVAESIYTIRNKKDVAHVKTLDPDVFDISYCVSACSWILAQLISIFYTKDINEANRIIISVSEKKIPLIEEFEDKTILVLRKDMPLTHEILTVLYHYYPARLSDVQLSGILRYYNLSYLRGRLTRLASERLVHMIGRNSKLTKLGIDFVEKKILTE